MEIHTSAFTESHTEFVADVVQKDVRRLQREGRRTRDDELNLSSVQSLPSYCVK